MEWIIANYGGIIAAVTAVVTAASAIAALTSTEKDDKFIAKIVNLLALNIDRVKK